MSVAVSSRVCVADTTSARTMAYRHLSLLCVHIYERVQYSVCYCFVFVLFLLFLLCLLRDFSSVSDATEQQTANTTKKQESADRRLCKEFVDMSFTVSDNLRYAIERGDVEAVDRLLQSGVSPNFELDAGRQTPLYAAAMVSVDNNLATALSISLFLSNYTAILK